MLRALAAKRDGTWPPGATPDTSVKRKRGWTRYAWVLPVGVMLAGAMLTLGNFVPSRTETAQLPAAPTAATTPPLETGASPEGLATYVDPLGVQEEVPWGELTVDLVLKLGLVLVLILGTLWLIRFVRRRGRPGSIPTASTSFSEILDTTELGPGQQVYLLDLGDRVLVLGATAQQVSSLSEITDAEEIETLRRRTGLRRKKTFADWLVSAVEKATPAAGAKPTADRYASVAQVAKRRQSLKRSSRRLRALAESYQEAKGTNT